MISASEKSLRCHDSKRWRRILGRFAAAIEAGADALLAASVFHFGIHRITDVKKYLSEHGYPMRMSSSV